MNIIQGGLARAAVSCARLGSGIPYFVTGLTEDLALIHNTLKLAPFFNARVIKVGFHLYENLCVFPMLEHSISYLILRGLLLLDAQNFLEIWSERRAPLDFPSKPLIFAS